MKDNSKNNERDWLKRIRQHKISLTEAEKEASWEKFQQRRVNFKNKEKRTGWLYWAAAAAIIVSLAIGVFDISQKEEEQQPGLVTNPAVKKNQVIIVQPVDTTRIEPFNTVKPDGQQQLKQIRNPLDSQDLLAVQVNTLLPDSADRVVKDSSVQSPVLASKPEEMEIEYLTDFTHPVFPGASRTMAEVKKAVRTYDMDTESKQMSASGN